jgi:hypothetical protein
MDEGLREGPWGRQTTRNPTKLLAKSGWLRPREAERQYLGT